MRLIEKMVQESVDKHGVGYDPEDAYVDGYLKGFRAAREMARKVADDTFDNYSGYAAGIEVEISVLGESEVEG